MKKDESSKFFNRELSWIEFNKRVLDEAFRDGYPLLERFKFLCITSSNFDEFFMVRVASVKRAILKDIEYSCPSKISAENLLEKIAKRTHELVQEQYDFLGNKLLPSLAKEGIKFCTTKNLEDTDISYIKSLFQSEVFSVMTPMKAETSKSALSFVNLQLYVAFWLRDGEGETHLAVAPIPSSLNRFYELPSDEGVKRLILLEDIIKMCGNQLFPGYEILEDCAFRVTKDMDLSVDEDDDKDFLRAMREVLIHREKSFPIRLEINKDSKSIREKLVELLEISQQAVYDIDGILDLKSLFSLSFFPGYPNLKLSQWSPCQPRDLMDEPDIFKAVKEKDILLHHPYEKFDPVIEMVQKAASDPSVIAIKMTLYRTSGDSPIVNALLKAALNKKEVTVLVELKARFDEGQNIVWAQKLEEVGANVIYGVAELKVHCKFFMVIRREEDKVRRYLHLGTGNYNEKTAEIYGDLALLTSRDDMTYEACLFFNAITGYSTVPNLSLLTMAPTLLKARLLSMIEREIDIVKNGGTAEIIAKSNSISDPEIIKAFYKASNAGVKIKLNIRGVCMLVPGVKGLSENIEVISIVGRFLEHSRIYYFRNNGKEEMFLASADLMTRNLEKRVELMFKVIDRDHCERIKKILQIYFADTLHAHKLLKNGLYERKKFKVNIASQEELYKEAKAYAKNFTSHKGELRVRKKKS
ncbi:MAG: polyphosphate kinase 1 [Lentisphaeraceae bacterium]|nr:polyphosphate kinase 1 [Lentisphaeraceae bacterium]